MRGDLRQRGAASSASTSPTHGGTSISGARATTAPSGRAARNPARYVYRAAAGAATTAGPSASLDEVGIDRDGDRGASSSTSSTRRWTRCTRPQVHAHPDRASRQAGARGVLPRREPRPAARHPLGREEHDRDPGRRRHAGGRCRVRSRRQGLRGDERRRASPGPRAAQARDDARAPADHDLGLLLRRRRTPPRPATRTP